MCQGLASFLYVEQMCQGLASFLYVDQIVGGLVPPCGVISSIACTVFFLYPACLEQYSPCLKTHG
jgi:hypothetical protein